jgi:hypothetical protein
MMRFVDIWTRPSNGKTRVVFSREGEYKEYYPSDASLMRLQRYMSFNVDHVSYNIGSGVSLYFHVDKEK